MKKLNDLPVAAEGEALPEPAATPAAVVAEAAEPLHPSLPVDEFHGVAGSYLYDPATGKRTRVDGPDLNQPEA